MSLLMAVKGERDWHRAKAQEQRDEAMADSGVFAPHMNGIAARHEQAADRLDRIIQAYEGDTDA